MSFLQVVILAVVQGVTEFLPISSSAHLALAPWLLGWRDQGLTFDIALHFGTVLAVVVYFFRDWLQVIAQGFGIRYGGDPDLARNPRLLWLMAVGSIPVCVSGLLLKDLVENQLRDPLQIGFMLISVGLLMALAERVGRRKRDIGHIGIADAIIIGCAQAVAVVPGTSRSGITITAALFRDLDRHAAARYSFLLSTPAILGAAVLKFKELMESGGIPEGLESHFAIGVALSAITGWLVIAWFLRFLQRNTLNFFVWYRILFGIIVIALAVFFR
jgi:undecaprenyl-diphosphatase